MRVLNDGVFCFLFLFFWWDLCRSAVFEMGNTKVIAAVYGPREVLIFLPVFVTP